MSIYDAVDNGKAKHLSQACSAQVDVVDASLAVVAPLQLLIDPSPVMQQGRPVMVLMESR